MLVKSILAATSRLCGPRYMVNSSSTRSTPFTCSNSALIDWLSRAGVASPTTSDTLLLINVTAITVSRPPMPMEAMPSHNELAVSSVRIRPIAANSRPTSAAESSSVTALSVVSGVRRR